jgi:hypothetical protein
MRNQRMSASLDSFAVCMNVRSSSDIEDTITVIN